MVKSTRRNRCNTGTSLLEVVSAIIMLSIAIPPLVGLYSEVSNQSVDQSFQDVAVIYADALMEEIVSKEFEDPDKPKGSFGDEEKNRFKYDDIDDYDGLDNSPPIHLDGSELADLAGFRRRVEIENVAAANPDTTKPEKDGSTNLKRIRVIVSWAAGRGGELHLTTLRARLSGSGEKSGPLNEQKSADSAKRKSSHSFQVDLFSSADETIQMKSFSLSADRAGSVTELKLGSKKIWDDRHGMSMPTGEKELSHGSSSQRSIPSNGERKLEVKFSDKPKGSVNYDTNRAQQLGIQLDWSATLIQWHEKLLPVQISTTRQHDPRDSGCRLRYTASCFRRRLESTRAARLPDGLKHLQPGSSRK